MTGRQRLEEIERVYEMNLLFQYLSQRLGACPTLVLHHFIYQSLLVRSSIHGGRVITGGMNTYRIL
jgi:hypothetical protein